MIDLYEKTKSWLVLNYSDVSVGLSLFIKRYNRPMTCNARIPRYSEITIYGRLSTAGMTVSERNEAEEE